MPASPSLSVQGRATYAALGRKVAGISRRAEFRLVKAIPALSAFHSGLFMPSVLLTPQRRAARASAISAINMIITSIQFLLVHAVK